jgi:hypothetical protein
MNDLIRQNFPLYFPLFFLVMWIIVTTLLGVLSGWSVLMRAYQIGREPPSIDIQSAGSDNVDRIQQ